jgi:hypothetical protein
MAIWGNQYLPMVDLPQYAALTAVWKHLDDPASGYRQAYWINYFTPYLLSYLLLRSFATFLPVLMAAKAVVTLSLLALPFACDHLVRDRGHDRWWCLLCFPLLFNNSFYWGFISFLVAVPIGILTLANGLRFLESRPQRLRGTILAALCLVLFFSHISAFLLVVSILVVTALASAKEWKSIGWRLLPLLVPLSLAAYWKFSTSADQHLVSVFAGAEWTFDRFLFLGGTISHHQDLSATLCVLAFFVVLFATARPRWEVSLTPWIPFLVTLSFVLFFPQNAGHFCLADRYSVFLFPTLLLGLVRSESPRRLRISRLFIVVSALFWLGTVCVRFRDFNDRIGPFDQVLAKTQPGRRLACLNYDNDVRGTPPGNQFMHFGAWYQALRGGRIGFSFAEEPHQVVRLAPGAALLSDGKYLSWNPTYFSWQRHGDFDYFLLRIRDANDLEMFLREAGRGVRLTHRAGFWLLFEHLPGRPSRRS